MNENLLKYFNTEYFEKHEWNMDILNSINSLLKKEIIGERFKRQMICNNTFNECILKYNAFSGSTFSNVHFENCRLLGNGFIGAVFKNVCFNSKIKRRYSSNNWSQAYFNNCLIHNAIIRSCTISQSFFLETVLSNVTFSAVTFENTIFRNCELDNVDFSTVNIDFMEMDKCKLNNVKFSFFSLPFIFGGMNVLKDGNILLSDQNDRIITSDEYIKVLPDLADYFTSKNEYFASCNINLFINNYDKALDNLNKGILRSLEINDFRMIKYYCKLGVMGGIIQDSYAKKILSTIENIIFNPSIDNSSKSNSALNEELLHYGEIRSILLNRNLNKNKVEMVIKTKILSENQEDVNLLLNTIDDVLTSINLGKDKNFIQIRHNSPVEIIVTYICQNLPTILGVASSIFSIVASFISIKSLIKKHKKISPEERRTLVLNEISKFSGVDINNPCKILDLRLDLACANLKNTLKKAKKHEIDQIIDEFTSCIHNVTSEELPNDVLLIKFNDNN